jgi:hypothetical protein
MACWRRRGGSNMKRADVLKVIPVLAAGATLLPKEAPAAIAHARPGDTLVFRVYGGHADLEAFEKQLPQIDGVTIVVVNEKVSAALLKDCLDKEFIDKTLAQKIWDEPDTGTCGYTRWGQHVADLRGSPSA